jgi:hypothetical protein
VSALNGSYVDEIERIKAALNGLSTGNGSIGTDRFESLGQFAEQMAAIERAVAA